MTKKTTTAAATALAITLGAATAAAVPAQAQGGDAVRAAGPCGRGVWTLKAKPDNGLIEIEFEVDTNRAGQVWHVRVKDNRHLVVDRNAITKAPSGSFTVRAATANRAGTDVIRAHAIRGDRVCGGAVQV
jgi:hypothetical protein